MYITLLFLHSLTRWFVVASLLGGIVRSATGFFGNKRFAAADDKLRNATMSIAHIQFTIGILLYCTSPLIRYFWTNFKVAKTENDPLYFGLIHMTLMFLAVAAITVGAGLAKRKQADKEKFGAMFFWFLAGLIIILLAIPWPFSPLAFRPYIRSF